MQMYWENTEAMAELCAANLTRLGCLYKRDGRWRAAHEVLDLAAKLGSLEAMAELIEIQPREKKRNHYRIVG